MTPQNLSGFLKSHWPLAVIAIAVAVLAFAAGALTSNRSVANEPTPATVSGSPPSYTPSPPTPLPTNVAGGASASACEGFLAPSGICVPETTPSSSAVWGPAYSGVEIGLSGGRKLQLPSDVYIAGLIDNAYCGPFIDNEVATPCPPTPLYTLKKGNSVVLIDFDGNIDGDGSTFHPSDFSIDFFAISESDVWDPAAFPFLPVSSNGD